MGTRFGLLSSGGRYVEEESAELALQKLTGRFYQGRMLQPEFCPVSDFKEPVCRQFDEAKCNRGGSARQRK